LHESWEEEGVRRVWWEQPLTLKVLLRVKLHLVLFAPAVVIKVKVSHC
jgi:hypothetical protein